MAEQANQGANKVTEQPVTSSPSDIEVSADDKSEEVRELETKKAQLEEEIRGKEGTVSSLDDDIIRLRQERKGLKEGEEQEPLFDKEALLAELDARYEEKLQAAVQPFVKETLKAKEAQVKAEKDALKAQKAALDSLNARLASATAASPSATQPSETEPEVELSDKEAQIAKELGLKNPRYMKEVEVL